MTVDLIARAEARISSLTSQVVALDAQAMDIRDRAMDCRLGIQELRQFITLARELADEPEQEPRPNATDGQAAEYAVVTPAAAEGVTAEDGHASSAPIPSDVHYLPLDRERENEQGAAEAGTVAPETISSESELPALSKRQQVRITAEDHPDWTAAQVAEHLGLTDGSVRGHASALGIKFAPAPAGTAVPRASSSLTKTDRVRLLHEQHPTWTARMLALELGEKESSVSTMLAIVRKQARAQAEPKPEFGSEQEMLQHYGDVAARLGKGK